MDDVLLRLWLLLLTCILFWVVFSFLVRSFVRSSTRFLCQRFNGKLNKALYCIVECTRSQSLISPTYCNSETRKHIFTYKEWIRCIVHKIPVCHYTCTICIILTRLKFRLPPIFCSYITKQVLLGIIHSKTTNHIQERRSTLRFERSASLRRDDSSKSNARSHTTSSSMRRFPDEHNAPKWNDMKARALVLSSHKKTQDEEYKIE